MALSPQTRQRALFAVLCVVWGVTWLALKTGAEAVPPGLFAGMRWTASGLILMAWGRLRGRAFGPPPRLIGRLVLVALLMISLSASVQLYALREVASGLAAVINAALTPISLLGFSVMLGQEKFRPAQLAAIGVGVAGLILLFGPRALAGQLTLAQALGALGVTIGCVAYCAGSVLSRPLMRVMAPAGVAGSINLIGGVVLLAVSLGFDPAARAALTLDWGVAAWSAWLFLLLASSLGASIIYFMLVRDWGASRTGSYAFVSPVIAVLLGVAVLGERLDATEICGMALMLVAAGLVLRLK